MDPVPRRTRTRIRIRIHIRIRIRRVPRRTRGRGGRRRAGGRGRRAGAGCGLSFRLHCRRGSSWRPRPMRTRVCGRRGASGPSRRIRRQTWMPCRDERVRSLRSRRLPTLGLPIGMLPSDSEKRRASSSRPRKICRIWAGPSGEAQRWILGWIPRAGRDPARGSVHSSAVSSGRHRPPAREEDETRGSAPPQLRHRNHH